MQFYGELVHCGVIFHDASVPARVYVTFRSTCTGVPPDIMPLPRGRYVSMAVAPLAKYATMCSFALYAAFVPTLQT
jgi:hypothetical protein